MKTEHTSTENNQEEIKFAAKQYHNHKKNAILYNGRKAIKILNYIKDDFVSTFKKYSHPDETLDDLKQPIFGVSKTVKGAVNLALILLLAPLYFVYDDIRNSSSAKDYFTNQVPSSVGLITTAIALHTLTLFRGLTQIAATPLMLAKVAFRGLLTLGSAVTSKLFESSQRKQDKREEEAHDDLLTSSSHHLLGEHGIKPQTTSLAPAPIGNHKPLFSPAPSATATTNPMIHNSSASMRPHNL